MRARFVLSVALSDLWSLGAAFVVASLNVFSTALPWNASLSGSIFPLLAFMAFSMVVSSFLTERMSGGGVPRPTYGRMLAILFGTIFITAGLLVLFRGVYFSRAFMASSALAWLAPATAHRFVRRRRPWTERIGVITNEKQLVDDLHATDHADVAWVLDPGFDGPIDLSDPGDTIAVDFKAVMSERVARYVSSCDVGGHTIRPFSSIYEEHTGRVPLVNVEEGWEISAPLLKVARWLPGKRLFDIAITVGTAILWVPVGLGVAAFVKLSDPGFSIFRQRRVGFGGIPFTMYKFRTMYLDAEKDGPRFAMEDDPRLIPGGRFLRRFRLDEIPQLWNVLKGDMSLVGPRAEQLSFAAEFGERIPFYDHRHMVRPGLTGWAQVAYRYADDQAETIEKLTYDLYYIKNMSPVMDLRIFATSVWVVLSGSGAR